MTRVLLRLQPEGDLCCAFLLQAQPLETRFRFKNCRTFRRGLERELVDFGDGEPVG